MEYAILGLELAAGGLVRITDLHERLLETRQSGACYTSPAGGAVIVGVFRRNTRGDTQDGMHLTNALKGRHGLRLERKSLTLLRRRAQGRILAHFGQGQVDLVVPAPSSAALAGTLALELARILGGVTVADPLRKPTVAEVLRALPPNGYVRQADLDLYEDAVRKLRGARPASLVAIKAIHRRVRRYFEVVLVRPGVVLRPGLNIVVVDDSSSSGATLAGTVRTLESFCRPASVTALALVGP